MASRFLPNCALEAPPGVSGRYRRMRAAHAVSRISRLQIAVTMLLMAAVSEAGAAALPPTQFLTAPGPITAVWANTGEDKVTQDELRTATGRRPVLNRSWD